MSYHSYNLDWTLGDELTDDVVKDIICGLKENKKYSGGDGYTPSCYSMFCDIDKCIYTIGQLLDKVHNRRITEKELERVSVNIPEILPVARTVFSSMGKLLEI